MQKGLGNVQLSKKKGINKVKAADKEGAEKAAKTVKDISTNLTLGTEIIERFLEARHDPPKAPDDKTKKTHWKKRETEVRM